MPRWPVDVPRATAHGKYGYVRRSSAEGGAGASGTYPSIHNALDLAGPKGTPVYAPEDCSVDSVSTGVMRPFRGYQPGVIVMRGKVSGDYHLLAHLQPGTIPSPTVPGEFWDFMTTPLWKSTDQRRQIAEGEQVGLIAKDHVHWETRRPGWNGARNNPALWVKRYVSPGLDVSQWTAAGGSDDDVLLWLLLGYVVLSR